MEDHRTFRGVGRGSSREVPHDSTQAFTSSAGTASAVRSNSCKRRRSSPTSGPSTSTTESSRTTAAASLPFSAASAFSRASVSGSRSNVRRTAAIEMLLVVQKAPQLARPARVLELAQRLGFDLADALAGHRELLADLFEGVVGVHADAEAHAQHALLARGQRGEHPRRGLAQVGGDRRLVGQDGVLVLDEIAEMRILLVADRGLERQRLLGDLQDLAHLLERHAELFGELLGGRLAADLVEHLAARAHDLVDGLDPVHRDADGARLIGDRAGDRLANPPGGVGRELVAAAVLEFVDRLHQADIAFLNEVEELQAAVGVFLGDGDDEAQVGFDHFLLGLARLALALLHHLHDLAEFTDLESGLGGERVDGAAQLPDAVLVAGDERLPAFFGQSRDAVEPARIELVALILAQESVACHAVAFGKPHQPALVADQPLVDVVEVLDQGIDAGLIEPQRLHLLDDLFLELAVLALLAGGERLVVQLAGDILLLQAAQALERVGDVVEGLQHLRLELEIG